jgi:transposase-like protein
MILHRNAKLGLAGRLALVQAIEGGMSMKAAAAAFGVSPATAHRWSHRWREAGEQARSSLGCLLDRSSRLHRSPCELAPELQERICACRRKTGWGRGWSLPSPALRTRRSGRCFIAPGSHGDAERCGSRPTATSGPVRATSCFGVASSRTALRLRIPALPASRLQESLEKRSTLCVNVAGRQGVRLRQRVAQTPESYRAAAIVGACGRTYRNANVFFVPPDTDDVVRRVGSIPTDEATALKEPDVLVATVSRAAVAVKRVELAPLVQSVLLISRSDAGHRLSTNASAAASAGCLAEAPIRCALNLAVLRMRS